MDETPTRDANPQGLGSRPIPSEAADACAHYGAAVPSQRQRDRSKERPREAAFMAGWRGQPYMTGWWTHAGATDPEVTARYARGLERRRLAMRLGVWYPGRDRPFVATIEERRASRMAVRAALVAQEIERQRLAARPPRLPALDAPPPSE